MEMVLSNLIRFVLHTSILDFVLKKKKNSKKNAPPRL